VQVTSNGLISELKNTKSEEIEVARGAWRVARETEAAPSNRGDMKPCTWHVARARQTKGKPVFQI
jgi:hypothetical protein